MRRPSRRPSQLCVHARLYSAMVLSTGGHQGQPVTLASGEQGEWRGGEGKQRERERDGSVFKVKQQSIYMRTKHTDLI